MIRRNPTTPLPDEFSDREPALLTKDEFLAMRNPEDKHHPSDAYSATLATLNRIPEEPRGKVPLGRHGDEILVSSLGTADDNNLVFRRSKKDGGGVVAVLHDGTMYRNRFTKIPPWYVTSRYSDKGGGTIALQVQREMEVKYPEEFVVKLHDVRDENRRRYPFVLQRVRVDREVFEVRAEAPPRANARDAIVFLNRDGLVVARGDDEWGATLTLVAEEYRGRGLGRALSEFWYEMNPRSTSGGFTRAGQGTAIATWESRVREFSARGWYSELVRLGRMKADRVKQVLSGLTKRRASSQLPEPAAPDAEPELLVYVDDDATAFVLYDKRFLDTPSEDFIHGYGFLRDSSSHGTFFFRLEHDPECRLMATAIGLQMARDQGEKIYVDEAPGDLIEWEQVPHAVYKDGYVSLKADVMPLKQLALVERRERKPFDPYRQKVDELVEMAESKWS